MMAEDWKPGDLARCVKWQQDVSFPPGSAGEPMVGMTYTVSAVSIGFDCYGRSGLALAFEEIRRGPSPVFGAVPIGYNHEFFRKVRPIQADEFDREVIEALRGEPVVAG